MLVILFIILIIIIVIVMKPKGFIRSAADNKPKYAKVYASRMDAVFEQLEAQAQEGSFAVVVLSVQDKPAPANVVNLQFSIKESRPGFDWALHTPLNIADRDRFVQCAESLGHTVIPHEDNGVQSLRVEDGDLPMLCITLMQELYHLDLDDKVYLFTEGFEWQDRL